MRNLNVDTTAARKVGRSEPSTPRTDEGSPKKKGRVANAADSEGTKDETPWYNTYHFE